MLDETQAYSNLIRILPDGFYWNSLESVLRLSSLV